MLALFHRSIHPGDSSKSNSKPNSQGIVVHFGKQLINRFGMIRVVVVTERVVAIHFRPLGSSEGQIDQAGVCQSRRKLTSVASNTPPCANDGTGPVPPRMLGRRIRNDVISGRFVRGNAVAAVEVRIEAPAVSTDVNETAEEVCGLRYSQYQLTLGNRLFDDDLAGSGSRSDRALARGDAGLVALLWASDMPAPAPRLNTLPKLCCARGRNHPGRRCRYRPHRHR